MDSQNENETPNNPDIDESMVVADNIQSSQSNNIEIEGI